MAVGPIARRWRTWRSLLKLCGEQEPRSKLLQSLAIVKKVPNVGMWLGWRYRKLKLLKSDLLYDGP